MPQADHWLSASAREGEPAQVGMSGGCCALNGTQWHKECRSWRIVQRVLPGRRWPGHEDRPACGAALTVPALLTRASLPGWTRTTASRGGDSQPDWLHVRETTAYVSGRHSLADRVLKLARSCSNIDSCRFGTSVYDSVTLHCDYRTGGVMMRLQAGLQRVPVIPSGCVTRTQMTAGQCRHICSRIHYSLSPPQR